MRLAQKRTMALTVAVAFGVGALALGTKGLSSQAVAEEPDSLEIRLIEDPWMTRLHPEYDDNKANTTLPGTKAQFQFQRGRKHHLAYYVTNNEDHEQQVQFAPNSVASLGAEGELSKGDLEIRVLTYRNANNMYFRNLKETPYASPWNDPDGVGFVTSESLESEFPISVENSYTDSWFVRHQTNVEGSGVKVYLMRETEPLPLFSSSDAGSATLVIPAGESRIVWVVATVPLDQPALDYEGTLFSVTTSDSKVYDVDVGFQVSCWDTDDMAEHEAKMYDYSYRLGRGIHEGYEGISNVDGVEVHEPAKHRADWRTAASHNTITWYVGHPSRDLEDASSLNPDFEHLLDQFVLDLPRYQSLNDGADAPGREVDTIVIGMTELFRMYPDLWKGDSEGDLDTWRLYYGQIFEDLFKGLSERGVKLDKFRWIVIPADEPAQGTGGVTFSRSDGSQHYVALADYWSSAARAIREWDENSELSVEILVNHSSGVSQATLIDFDQCYDDFGDDGCVDIWMVGHLMDADTTPSPHVMLGTVGAERDEFWWYDFQNDQTFTTARRHMQAGAVMKPLGYSGSANWTMWSMQSAAYSSCANGANELYPIDCAFTQSSPAVVPHTWERAMQDPFLQQNTVYFNDQSSPSWVPWLEEVSPGRIYYARREALELDRLLWKVETMPGLELSYAAQVLLTQLLEQASDPCHSESDCWGMATTDGVAVVLNNWLDTAYSCEDIEADACDYVRGFPASMEILNACKMQPWVEE